MIARETSSAAAATSTLAGGWRIASTRRWRCCWPFWCSFGKRASDMASIWWRSDTYAHGMIVPPITHCGWSGGYARDSSRTDAHESSYLAVFLLGGAGLGWLLGQVAAVNALSQFALVAMLVLGRASAGGLARSRAGLRFRCCSCFFAVPFGDFTQPKLMEWTADATVAGLRLSGIPVYREGQHLVIPSGQLGGGRGLQWRTLPHRVDHGGNAVRLSHLSFDLGGACFSSSSRSSCRSLPTGGAPT
jgi:hypothetical protein